MKKRKLKKGYNSFFLADKNNIKHKQYSRRYLVVALLAFCYFLLSMVMAGIVIISTNQKSNLPTKYYEVEDINTIATEKGIYKELPKHIVVVNTNQEYLKGVPQKYANVKEGSNAYKFLNKRIGKLKDLTVLERYRTKYSTWDYRKTSKLQLKVTDKSKLINQKDSILGHRIGKWFFRYLIGFILVTVIQVLYLIHIKDKYLSSTEIKLLLGVYEFNNLVINCYFFIMFFTTFEIIAFVVMILNLFRLA